MPSSAPSAGSATSPCRPKPNGPACSASSGSAGIIVNRPCPPVTALVVRQMGGWARACSWKDADLPWRHRDFIELWKIALGNEDALNSAKGRAALPAPDCPAPQKRLPLPPPPLKPDPSGPFALRLAKLRKEMQKTQKIQRGK